MRASSRCIAGLTAAWMLAAEPAAAQPDIVFDQRKLDLGVWTGDDDLRSAIRIPFRNEGDRTLVITKRGGCPNSCSTDKKEYAPGESGVVLVARGRVLGTGPRDGIRGCEPKLWTNDPGDEEVTLSLSVDARPRLWTMSQHSGLDAVEKDEPVTVAVSVYGRDVDLQQLEASVEDSRETAEVGFEFGSIERLRWERTGETVSKRTVIVRVLPGAAVGLHDIRLEFALPDTEQPIRHSLVFSHRGDLEFEPRRSFLGDRRPGEVVEHELELRSRSGTPFSVLGVEKLVTAPDDVQITLVGGERSVETHRVMLRAVMPEGEGRFLRRLTVVTDVEREEHLELRLYAIVTKPDSGLTD